MIMKRGKDDYTRVFRPCRVSEVYGQKKAKRVIKRGLNEKSLPHSLLFRGTSGTGKTTMARIIAMGLNCDEGQTSEPCCQCDICQAVLRRGGHLAYEEINASEVTGIDRIRKLTNELNCGLMIGENRVIVFDECHGLTPQAQGALLKAVEDSHDMNYFIFCSTVPEQIIETLRNRCMPIEFRPIADEEIRKLLIDVCAWENVKPHEEVLERIVKEAEGRARNALHLLQKAVLSLT